MAYGNLGYNNTIFTGERDIKDGTIYSVGTGRERIKVGVDLEREQELLQINAEMQETLDNWREVLIENGLLKLPKTAEEIAQEAAAEQMRIMQEQEQRQQERDAQQFELNKTLLESARQTSNLMSHLEGSLKQSNKTIIDLQNKIEGLIKSEHNENAGRNVPERIDPKLGAGKSNPKPGQNSKSHKIQPSTDTKSVEVGADSGIA